jgi:hypothetical protein
VKKLLARQFSVSLTSLDQSPASELLVFQDESAESLSFSQQLAVLPAPQEVKLKVDQSELH